MCYNLSYSPPPSDPEPCRRGARVRRAYYIFHQGMEMTFFSILEKMKGILPDPGRKEKFIFIY